jgi:hypothetical protein
MLDWANYLTGFWYQEISKYNFSAPESNFGQVGIGLSVFNTTINGTMFTMIFYVANYFKPGNIRGRFGQNIFPVIN